MLFRSVMGVSTSAASVLFAARQAGTMNETAVTVAPVGRSRSVSAPDGVRGLAERIPHAQEGEPQVRIERYGSADAPQWIVYIGGTIDWSPESTSEPWDLTSNIVAVAEQQSGSYRAVLEAMELAGIGPDDPVAEVGHSQGGLVAAQIAASEKFNTVAVLTFGAPAGQVAVPAAVPMLAVAHTDDLVPALGGTARDSTAQGNAHLLVRREVYADTPIPDDVPLPAHRMTTYADTAALIDESNEPRIVAFTAGIAALAAAGTAAGTYAPASVALGGGAVGAPAGAAAGAPVGAAPGSAPAGAVGAAAGSAPAGAVGAAAGASGAGATGAQAPASAAPAAGLVTFWRGTRTAPTK